MSQQQKQVQLQFNLQITDDTWGRLIKALEALEAVTNNDDCIATYEKDPFREQGNYQVYSQEDKVQLQIEAFKKVVAPVRSYENTTAWLLQDFIFWMGRRKELPLNYTDDYALPVLQCILNEPFRLPQTPDELMMCSQLDRQKDMQSALEGIGRGLHETDRISEEFARNPHKKSSFGTKYHKRGEFSDGMDRIKKIAIAKDQKLWFKRFVDEKQWQNEQLDSSIIESMVNFVKNLFNA